MSSTHNKNESGQILVFVVLFIIGLFGMLALVLDGGNTYAKRRSAQNAADAGALAGARTLCVTKSASQAVTVAKDFATNKNEADTAAVHIDGLGYVTVTTRITFDTFFAHLIGRPQMTAEAQAVAGCFPPDSARVLPVAWACHPPTAGSDSSVCEEKTVSEEQAKDYMDAYPHRHKDDPAPTEIPDEMYVIMDTQSTFDDTSTICISQGGELQCDLDGDGDDDLIGSGDKSWLDLSGNGGNANDLTDWITGDQDPGPLTTHTWYGGQSGAISSVFMTVADYEGQVVYLPVYDRLCTDEPDPGNPSGPCADTPTTDTDGYVHDYDKVKPTSGTGYYFHIVSFVPFYISCVNAPGRKDDLGQYSCPGHDFAVEVGAIADHVSTIEGYFLDDQVAPDTGGGDPNGVDLGLYNLKLYK